MKPGEQTDSVLTFSVVKQWLAWSIVVRTLDRQSVEASLRKSGDNKAHILTMRKIEASYVGGLDMQSKIISMCNLENRIGQTLHLEAIKGDIATPVGSPDIRRCDSPKLKVRSRHQVRVGVDFADRPPRQTDKSPCHHRWTQETAPWCP